MQNPTENNLKAVSSKNENKKNENPKPVSAKTKNSKTVNTSPVLQEETDLEKYSTELFHNRKGEVFYFDDKLYENECKNSEEISVFKGGNNIEDNVEVSYNVDQYGRKVYPGIYKNTDIGCLKLPVYFELSKANSGEKSYYYAYDTNRYDSEKLDEIFTQTDKEGKKYYNKGNVRFYQPEEKIECPAPYVDCDGNWIDFAPDIDRYTYESKDKYEVSCHIEDGVYIYPQDISDTALKRRFFRVEGCFPSVKLSFSENHKNYRNVICYDPKTIYLKDQDFKKLSTFSGENKSINKTFLINILDLEKKKDYFKCKKNNIDGNENKDNSKYPEFFCDLFGNKIYFEEYVQGKIYDEKDKFGLPYRTETDGDGQFRVYPLTNLVLYELFKKEISHSVYIYPVKKNDLVKRGLVIEVPDINDEVFFDRVFGGPFYFGDHFELLSHKNNYGIYKFNKQFLNEKEPIYIIQAVTSSNYEPDEEI